MVIDLLYRCNENDINSIMCYSLGEYARKERERERKRMKEEEKESYTFITSEDPVIEDSRVEKVNRIKEIRDGIVNQIKNFDVFDNIEISIKDNIADAIEQMANTSINRFSTIRVFIARPFNDICYHCAEGLDCIRTENDRVINKIKEESNYKDYYMKAIYNAYKLNDKYSTINDMTKTLLLKDISLLTTADIVYFPIGWKEYKECRCYEAIAREYSSTIIYETEE